MFSHAAFKPKDLVPTPWMVAMALQEDGWYLRCDVIWSKGNTMPESITDRPTKAHEYLFLLTKRERYFYDAEAVKEPSAYGPRLCVEGAGNHTRSDAVNDMRTRPKHTIYVGTHRNRRSVWSIATEPYAGAHFATFPEALVEPCVLAGTSERGACPVCGAPWARVVEKNVTGEGKVCPKDAAGAAARGSSLESSRLHSQYFDVDVRTTGWAPTCPHDAAPVPCRVLDPFAGSGTVATVAKRLGRMGIGVEISAPYLDLAGARTSDQEACLWAPGG